MKHSLLLRQNKENILSMGGFMDKIEMFLFPSPLTDMNAVDAQKIQLSVSREQALTAITRITAIVGFIFLGIGWYLFYSPQQTLFFILYGFMLTSLWLAALFRQMNYQARVFISVMIWLIFSIITFISYGWNFFSIVFLISFCLLSAMFAGERGAWISSLISIGVIFCVGWQLYTGMFPIMDQGNHNIRQVTLPILSITIILFILIIGEINSGIIIILRNLERAWGLEKKARQEVEEERNLLELNVAERTRELTQACERAITASQYQTEFMAKVSHDLRNPLSAIQSYTDILQDGMLGMLTPEQAHAINHISININFLDDLIEDLLDYASIERGQLNIVYKTFLLQDVTEQACGHLRSLAEAKGLDFIIEIDPKLPESIVGDEKRIKQILGNLISNAIKFTSTGYVKVIITQGGDQSAHWMIQVSDTGPGIPENMQNTIFMPFKQLEGTNKNLGHGLGLSIVSQLTKLMGGEVHLDSTIGMGSTFSVILPLRTDQTKSFIFQQPHNNPS